MSCIFCSVNGTCIMVSGVILMTLSLLLATLRPILSVDTWSTKNRALLYKNDAFVMKGIAMNGIESGCRVPLGLDRRPLEWHMDTMQSLGFNVIRLPLSYESIGNLGTTTACWQPTFDVGRPIRDVIQRFLDESQKRGMFVMLDLHTIRGSITPLPWTFDVSEDDVIGAWANILLQFGTHPALMGIEIKNEPHNECSTTTFLRHCARVIRRIETDIPSYSGLYVISGVQTGGSPWGGAFDANGLVDTANDFLSLKTPLSRMVLNPHVYSQSVRGAQASSDGPGTWESAYGFVTGAETIWNQTAVVVTEWGGHMTWDDTDYYTRWMDWHISSKKFAAGACYWTFGPFSDDTGGLYDNNYQIIQNKMDMINRLDGMSRRVLGLTTHSTRLRGGGV